jgi:NAD(P)-dependent dehydrogenase (short-subunit alcohol dehydrogenase family)
MAGTIIITGANGSLAIPAVAYLLSNYPDNTAILTVRNASDADANTTALRAVISRHPQAKAVILELDLSVLSAVHDFTNSISKDIDNGTYPKLTSIVCNAFWWSLTSAAPVLTTDGYEKSVQVNHIAHAALVLRLLNYFEPVGGRIVTLGSGAHVPGKATFEQIPPKIPDVLDSLVKPSVEASYPVGQPFQRYGNSKLAVIMWTHALNRRLAQVSPPQSSITRLSSISHFYPSIRT